VSSNVPSVTLFLSVTHVFKCLLFSKWDLEEPFFQVGLFRPSTTHFCVAYTPTVCKHTMASSDLFIYLFICLRGSSACHVVRWRIAFFWIVSYSGLVKVSRLCYKSCLENFLSGDRIELLFLLLLVLKVRRFSFWACPWILYLTILLLKVEILASQLSTNNETHLQLLSGVHASRQIEITGIKFLAKARTDLACVQRRFYRSRCTFKSQYSLLWTVRS